MPIMPMRLRRRISRCTRIGREIGGDGVQRGHVAGAHLEDADLVPAAPAEQTAAADDRDDAAVLEADPAAEKDHRDLRVVARGAALGAEAEELFAFHEELALLRDTAARTASG